MRRRRYPGRPRWQYQPKNGDMFLADRTLIREWAAKDAAQRNGYRPGKPTSDTTTTHLRCGAGRRTRLPDPPEDHGPGELGDDLGRTGTLATVAQQIHGSKYGSRRTVIKIGDAAHAEHASSLHAATPSAMKSPTVTGLSGVTTAQMRDATRRPGGGSRRGQERRARCRRDLRGGELHSRPTALRG